MSSVKEKKNYFPFYPAVSLRISFSGEFTFVELMRLEMCWKRPCSQPSLDYFQGSLSLFAFLCLVMIECSAEDS